MGSNRRKSGAKQANYQVMSDSPPPPDNATNPDAVPAQNVPNMSNGETESQEIETPDAIEADPEALAADRAGFKFLAVGFAIFFVIIFICAGIVALAMKNMGI